MTSSSFNGPPPPPAGTPPPPPPSSGALPPAGPLPGGGRPFLTREAAMERVRWPAICLIVTAGIGVVLQVLMLLGNALSIVSESGLAQIEDLGQLEGYDLAGTLMAGSIGIAGNVIGIVVGALIIYAAMQMMGLKSWGLCLAGAILALIPCIGPCCCLSLPFGIWAIVVLLDDEVKAAFA